MNSTAWLEEIRHQFRKTKSASEKAAKQVADRDFFTRLTPGGNSIATLMKHLGGNHRSRWRDFLTSDGEKSDRHRDSEFVTEGETRESIQTVWEEGWGISLDTLDSLRPADLEKSITIRGEPHTVVEALQRGLTHAAYHSGQIVLLARYFAGDSWETLSIPLGGSEEFNARMREKTGHS